MAFVEMLRALLDRRLFDCRLTPDRALGTLAEAEAFLRDRGLLTRTADCALPSLYEACTRTRTSRAARGSPAGPRPSGRGSAGWPSTAT
jgi:hypothetical protein